LPVDILDFIRLLIGIIILIIPGYLWSIILFKKISILERIIFGFVLTISLFVLAFFCFDFIIKIPATQTKTIIIYVIYISIPSTLFLKTDFRKNMFLQIKKIYFTSKKIIFHPRNAITQDKNLQILIILACILVFSAFMGFLPHLKEGYYLPIHVDEWIHWSYSKSFMESGYTVFTNPYEGSGTIKTLEPGFNYLIASVSWLSGVGFNTLFVFMPTIITVFASIIAFDIGNNGKNRFGLEAAFCVALIPTTCRMLGPSFFVPLATGLLLLLFLLWFLGIKKPLVYIFFIPLVIWIIFIIHPPTGLAGMIITFIYAINDLFEKKYKTGLLTFLILIFPITGGILLSSRWAESFQQIIEAFFKGEFFLDLNLPKIWVSFEQMGIIIWILAVLGMYSAFSKTKNIIRNISISAIAFIIIIGLYDKLGYGIPILYERSFMYLFLMIGLLSGWGLAELRRFMSNLSKNERFIKRIKTDKKIVFLCKFFTPFLVVIIVITTVSVHTNIEYYNLIDEKDYETFQWVRENIGQYIEANKTSENKVVLDPIKAASFSAVTRLPIVCSAMNPLQRYGYYDEVEAFLADGCKNSSFFEKFEATIVYNQTCDNKNLTLVYPSVYVYMS
jgi:hypothetical protein